MQAQQPPNAEIAEQLGQELLDELMKNQLEIDDAKALALVAAGAKLDMQTPPDKASLTALMLAAVKHKQEVGLAILAKTPHAQLDIRSATKFTALLYAVPNGSTKIALELLKRGADAKAVNDTNVGALEMAAEKGEYEVAVVLLDKGIDPDLPDRPFDVTTPLMKTAYYGHEKIARALLKRGANIERLDEHGVNAHDRAIGYTHHNVATAIAEAAADRARRKEKSFIDGLARPFNGRAIDTEAPVTAKFRPRAKTGATALK